MPLDLAINAALLYDGSGRSPSRKSLGIRAGIIEEIREKPYSASEAREVVDASDKWVTPGFVDIHTHYDAEVEAAPALSESLRHGVTTVVFGSCSLGTVLSSPVDIADMFTRVEGIPRGEVLPLFEAKKTWSTPREYREHLDSLPLGPNVAAFLGHSDVRASVMGLGRSVKKGERPTAAELARMEELVEEAIEAGFLGLSVNTNRWDKLGGSRFRSKPLPSTYAEWDEIRALVRIVRESGRVLQAIPNISAKYDLFLFLWESLGLGRAPLRTSIVSMVDVRSSRVLYRVIGTIARIANGVFGADFKMQALPMPFQMFVDGLDAPVFEEFRAGTAALHLEEMAERRSLLRDPKYRSWFRDQWTSFWAPKVFHRDFGQSEIVACPDASVVGKSFEAIAKERGKNVVEVFLDLCAEHGDRLRWYTTIGNDRPEHLRNIVAHPDVLIGFSDAGAHLRNMAFYNFPLYLLKIAHDAKKRGVEALSVERAVYRLTKEIADWMGLDAGHLVEGARADLVVIDPEKLDDAVEDQRIEAPMKEFGGYSRMVRRNDAAVPFVVVGGKIAIEQGVPRPSLGKEPIFGRFLAAYERVDARDSIPSEQAAE